MVSKTEATAGEVSATHINGEYTQIGQKARVQEQAENYRKEKERTDERKDRKQMKP
jgi:hypothetical protein